PAGPTSTKSCASSAPVSGSHSSGGQITREPLLMPMSRCSVSAVMKAPNTGPRERLYGNLMMLSTVAAIVGNIQQSRERVLAGPRAPEHEVDHALDLGPLQDRIGLALAGLDGALEDVDREVDVELGAQLAARDASLDDAPEELATRLHDLALDGVGDLGLVAHP